MAIYNQFTILAVIFFSQSIKQESDWLKNTVSRITEKSICTFITQNSIVYTFFIDGNVI